MTGPTPADNLVLDVTRNRSFQHGANGVDMEMDEDDEHRM
jgi:hypothetical protein